MFIIRRGAASDVVLPTNYLVAKSAIHIESARFDIKVLNILTSLTLL